MDMQADIQLIRRLLEEDDEEEDEEDWPDGTADE
jgi:hypothetical protein